MDHATDQDVEAELDAAMAALGPMPSYFQAILEGVAFLRPTLVGGLPELTGIAADRLAAATGGQLELDPDEIQRIEDAVDLCALELATATLPPVEDGDELGALSKEVIQSSGRLFRASKAARMATDTDAAPAAAAARQMVG